MLLFFLLRSDRYMYIALFKREATPQITLFVCLSVCMSLYKSDMTVSSFIANIVAVPRSTFCHLSVCFRMCGGEVARTFRVEDSFSKTVHLRYKCTSQINIYYTIVHFKYKCISQVQICKHERTISTLKVQLYTSGTTKHDRYILVYNCTFEVKQNMSGTTV